MIREKKIPTDIINKLPHLAKEVESLVYVNALYFFGSLVKGGLKPLSDIDIAVLFMNSVSRKDREKLVLDLMGVVEEKLSTSEFDLIELNSAPLRFAYNVLKEGKLVFVKDKGELIDFREKTVKHYLDFNYYRRQLDKDLLERIGFHG